MTTKQSNIIQLASSLGVNIINIDDYKNKDSVLKCKCANGHCFTNTVDYLIKTNFECIDCIAEHEHNINDMIPYFLALDAATYVSGMSIFNKEGQLLGHKTFKVDKKKDYFTRLYEIVQEIKRIAIEQNIKCVILEDIQYQQNPVLFKKLAMLQGVIRYLVINVLNIELITAMADEWRSFNHIYGIKRKEQKIAAIEKARLIYKTDIPEDESESIFLGRYGIHEYYKNRETKEE